MPPGTYSDSARRRAESLHGWRAACLFVFAILSAAAPSSAQTAPDAASDSLGAIRSYISTGWNSLSRSLSDCSTFSDTKLTTAPQLYLPADLQVPDSVKQLPSRCNVELKTLPASFHHPGDLGSQVLEPAGLLYLEHPYVVPGGRFNEMYGWDSYFIILGLVRDHRLDLAQGMVDNFLFEVEHYGAVLNANRSYYLTRSQPPFLTSMILAVHEARVAERQNDREWLTKAYALAVKDHSLWASEPHLAGATGLARYFDFGDGPAPESLKDETDHYREVVAYFLNHPEVAEGFLIRRPAGAISPAMVGSVYSLQVCDIPRTMARPGCISAQEIALSSDFYKGDRAMRESGYDISFRFGPFGAGTHHFAPVCLNSLLFKTEKDLEELASLLGRKDEAERWQRAAEQRKSNIQKYLWDPGRGLYFDYDFQKQTRSNYEYVSTFYPLWAGISTPEQAQALRKHLPDLEQPGGLVMSTQETGAQWDFPYAWAPSQFLAVTGLRRYGFNEDADRVSYKFLSTVAENFRRDGTIREKYNAVTRSSETQVTAGYHANVVGFGWTNGVFLELLRALPPELEQRLANEQGSSDAKPH